MADYLPEMTLPKEPQVPVPQETDEDPLVSTASADEGAVKMTTEELVNNETEEENPNFQYESEEEEEEPLPVEPKKKLKKTDVFRTPQVLGIADPEKPPKKKRVVTQKQLDALARARETNRLKREEAKKLKEEGKPVPLTKKKLKQKKEVTEIVKNQQMEYSAEQISAITTKAIADYEVTRKARKEVKKKEQAHEVEALKVKQTLNRALGTPDPNDFWGQALKGLI
tara:strand:+ start:461 stop:1138 length:678 start_codon:yes stop_codon:yes gene_type:complete